MELRIYNEIDDDLLEVLLTLEQSIFENPYTREKFRRKISDKVNLLVMVYFDNEIPCAFKIGFELSSEIFYSWIGGVVPHYRKRGLALELMKKQHDLASQMGYKIIRTQTENKFKAMLIFNLKYGFDIVGISKSDSDGRQIIILEKDLPSR